MKAGRNLLFVAVLVVLVICGSAWAVNGDGLVSHWQFDEGSGPIAYDSAGDNDGTIYGAQWTTGKVGDALWFDGADDYVALPDNNPIWLPQNDFTLSVWVYFERQPDVTTEYILDLNFGSSSDPDYELGYAVAREGPLGGKLGFYITTTTNPDEYLYTDDVLAEDRWYHIVAVRDGTIQAIYIDGQFNKSRTCSPDPIDFVGGYDDDRVNIGKLSRFGGHPFSWQLKGTIDDVRIYDQALSAEEIEELYQSGLPIMIDVDIKPGSCPNPLNLAIRGVLPVAILGSEDFDVSLVDSASVQLAGVSAIRSSLEDVAAPVSGGQNECECTTEGPDDYTDLTLKFKTQQIVNSLGEPGDGETLVLTLTSVLTDGISIEGTDCIVVVGKVPRPLAAKRADINGDGIVNILDFSMIAEYWLEPAVVEY